MYFYVISNLRWISGTHVLGPVRGVLWKRLGRLLRTARNHHQGHVHTESKFSGVPCAYVLSVYYTLCSVRAPVIRNDYLHRIFYIILITTIPFVPFVRILFSQCPVETLGRPKSNLRKHNIFLSIAIIENSYEYFAVSADHRCAYV